MPELHGQRGMWNLCEYFNRDYLFLLKRLMMMSIRAKVSLPLRFIDDDLYSDRVELLLLIHVSCGENMSSCLNIVPPILCNTNSVFRL